MLITIVSLVVIVYAVGALFANYVNWETRKRGFTGVAFKTTLNPFKWISVVQGYVLSKIFPYHIFVQIAARVFEPNCQTCLREGFCNGGLNKEEGEEGCGCHTYQKMLSMSEKDTSDNWASIEKNKEVLKMILKEYPLLIKTKITEDDIF